MAAVVGQEEQAATVLSISDQLLQAVILNGTVLVLVGRDCTGTAAAVAPVVPVPPPMGLRRRGQVPAAVVQAMAVVSWHRQASQIPAAVVAVPFRIRAATVVPVSV
jgi:hypothetical protein